MFQAFIMGPATSGLYRARIGRSQRHFIPHVVEGRFAPLDYETEVLLRNAGQQDVSAQIQLFDPQGGPAQAGPSLILKPGQVKRQPLASGQESFTGWARLDAEGGPIEVFVRITSRRSGEVFSQVSVPPVVRREEGFWFNSLAGFPRQDGGVAFVNPYNAGGRIWVDYLVEGLGIERQMEIVIPAKSQRTILFSDIAPQSSCCSGLLRYRADFPIPAFSLRLDGLRIASQPIFSPR